MAPAPPRPSEGHSAGWSSHQKVSDAPGWL